MCQGEWLFGAHILAEHEIVICPVQARGEDEGDERKLPSVTEENEDEEEVFIFY